MAFISQAKFFIAVIPIAACKIGGQQLFFPNADQ